MPTRLPWALLPTAFVLAAPALAQEAGAEPAPTEVDATEVDATEVDATEVDATEAGSVDLPPPPTAEQAEAQRLREHMAALAGRGAWKGVHTAYERLAALELALGSLTAQDHLLGADAARAVGHLDSLVARLEASVGVEPTVSALAQLRRLDGAHGPVKLVAQPGQTLEPTTFPFDPLDRTLILYAQDQLAARGTFAGPLPRGTYTLGPAHFSVTGAPALVDVDVVPVPAVDTPPPPRPQPV